MQDSQNLKDLQIQLNRFISRLEELERENKYLKEQVLNQQCQLMQNVKIIDAKYQKIHRKQNKQIIQRYLKCLYKYGMSQSCLTNMITQYNKLIDKFGIDDSIKMDLKGCTQKYGVIYEKNKIIDEEEMNNIINERISKESEEIYTLFFPTKAFQYLTDNDSLQNTSTFQSLQSQRYRMQNSLQNNSEMITDNSDDTIINNLTTQRYLEKLQFDYQNDQTLHYPKTFKVEKLLQQTNRDLSLQNITDRSQKSKFEKRGDNKQEQIKISPLKSLNQSGIEDRVKRFDNQENEGGYPRRRSRADRIKQQQ
ncbi:unnamed protein product (macronuclear) [Paramecium tetraurelia]|uniref:Uncharacterized protein n=1 Tax=Paramecium tetraurelia TaxID=5888 RepID=A0BWD6_PARTE|nr:uncharacterized protein GSPATT00032705001 [Paramecium tetraurelia]CAK62853.1 unnamed protein product [Paramecium tetraurelia]|eukprot:XP_001430251.1 hypothetical protein (macronuclear) [Paramecium tetraurelia strain d4-2]